MTCLPLPELKLEAHFLLLVSRHCVANCQRLRLTHRCRLDLIGLPTMGLSQRKSAVEVVASWPEFSCPLAYHAADLDLGEKAQV